MMYEWFWFGIPEYYSIKQFVHLTNMQLFGVICINFVANFSCTQSWNVMILVVL